MGRVKTAPIKRITEELLALNKDKFTKNFQENKAVINNLISTPSKKIRNVITGYITRLMKKQG